MRHLLFDIHENNTGRTFRVWSDGYLDGFSDDAIISNHAAPLLDAYVGVLRQLKALSPEAAAIVDRVQALLSDPKISGVGSEPFGGMLPQLAQALAKDRG